MTVTDKYWLQVNKKYFKYDIFAVIILSGIFEGLAPLGICYYMYRIMVYSMRYLNMSGLFSINTEGLNQILILPFSREQIYKTYVKMILLMSTIFTIIVALSKSIYTLFGENGTITNEDGTILELSFLANVGYYLIFFCALLILIITLVNKINSNTPKTTGFRSFLMFSMLFDLVITNFFIMLLLLSSSLAQNIYFVLSLLGTGLLILILINCIKKNYQEFVVKFRRYIHVE